MPQKKSHDLNFSLAGLGCSIKFNRIDQYDYLSNFFNDFITDKKPDFTINITGGVGKDSATCVMVLPPSGKLFQIKKPLKQKMPLAAKLNAKTLCIKGKGVVGTFDLDKLKGDFVVSQIEPLRNIMRLLYALLLLERNVIVLHSSAIKDDTHQALVFSGPSEAGKSTIATFSGQPALSEDINILKFQDKKVIVCSTPFGGLFQTKKIELPLGKLFFIKKSRETFLEKLDKAETLVRLMENNLLNPLISEENPEIGRKLFNLTHKLCRHIDAYELFFEKNNKFWEKIKELP